MLLADKDILSFQELYIKHIGEEISKEDAYSQAVKLLELVRVVYQPITITDFEQIKKNEN